MQPAQCTVSSAVEVYIDVGMVYRLFLFVSFPLPFLPDSSKMICVFSCQRGDQLCQNLLLVWGMSTIAPCNNLAVLLNRAEMLMLADCRQHRIFYSGPIQKFQSISSFMYEYLTPPIRSVDFLLSDVVCL